MAVSPETRGFVEELFTGLGGISFRRVMGGLAVYANSRIFCLVTSDERIYLKATGAVADALAANGSEQFAYPRGGKVVRMGYWTLPDAALDDPDAATEWARRALAAFP